MKFLSLLGLAALIHCASAMNTTPLPSGDKPLNGARQEARSPCAGEAASSEEMKTNAVAPTKPVDTAAGADPEGKAAPQKAEEETKATEEEGLDSDDDGALEMLCIRPKYPDDKDDLNEYFLLPLKYAEIAKTIKHCLEYCEFSDKKVLQAMAKREEHDAKGRWYPYCDKCEEDTTVDKPKLSCKECAKRHIFLGSSNAKVSGETLKSVGEYLTRHEGKSPGPITKPIRSKIMAELEGVSAEDAEFIDRVGSTKKRLFLLVLAANYLQLTCLVHLGCAKIATMIKGKTPDEIKEILGADEAELKEAGDPDWGLDGKDRRRLYQILGLDKLLEPSQPDRDL